MADTPVLMAATAASTVILGLIGQKVLRANAREIVQKDLYIAEQKRADEIQVRYDVYREAVHEYNNKTTTNQLTKLSEQDKEHATELAALRSKHDEMCERLREDRDKFRGLYMELHAEVNARKSVFIGSVEAWPIGEKKEQTK